MLVKLEDCLPLFRCPRTGLPLQDRGGDELVTVADDPGQRRAYRVVHGLPILVDFERSVLDEEKTLRSFASSPVRRPRYGALAGFARGLVSAPEPATRANVAHLVGLLKAEHERPRVLVIGGASIGQNMQPLYEDERIEIHAFDIYASPNVQFIADGHALPLAEGVFDCVIVQAILEHVLQPDQVVAEIHRVLKPDGLVYAETPFLQHVHEGAYDFTRYTDSGHRYLFRRFELVCSGVVGGPGTQLLWSLDYFVRALFRSRAIGKGVKLAFFWLRYLDRVVPEPYAIDAASGLYFLGRKSAREMSAKDVIAYYKGAL